MKPENRRHLAVAVLLLLIGFVGYGALKSGRQAPARERKQPPAPLVRAMVLEPTSATIRVRGEGIVEPLHETLLAAQVAGRVVHVSPSLVDGGRVSRGDLLLRIEPLDYELGLTLREAELRDAEKNLELAREDAAAAREEWSLLHDEEPPPLVAKEPQMAVAEAALEAARARLQQAQLNLDRTSVRAPFDGVISERRVDLGQYVGPGAVVARIASIESAEITVNLDDRELAWLRVPGLTAEPPGSPAEVRVSLAGTRSTWSGQVMRAGARIDPTTRMVPVVVRVVQPYSRTPPLALGLFVEVELQGERLENATRLPTNAVQAEDRIWVLDTEDRLRLLDAPIVRRDAGSVLLHPGLEPGTRVVLTPPAGATDGMAVRVRMDDDGDASGVRS